MQLLDGKATAEKIRIELKEAGDLSILVERMKKYNFKFDYLNNKNLTYNHIQKMQSTMSSSHSKLGNNQEDSLYGDEGENPFKLPSDELIFSFKETEKDRKIIEREKNKQLKSYGSAAAEEQLFLLENEYKGFIRSGAALPEDKKEFWKDRYDKAMSGQKYETIDEVAPGVMASVFHYPTYNENEEITGVAVVSRLLKSE